MLNFEKAFNKHNTDACVGWLQIRFSLVRLGQRVFCKSSWVKTANSLCMGWIIRPGKAVKKSLKIAICCPMPILSPATL